VLGRSAALASGAPNGAVGPPGTAGDVAANPLAAGIAEATWLKAGADEVQPWGTDNTPSEAARPTFAVTAALPIPGEPRAPAPELQPLLSADPNTGSPLPKALVAEPIELMSEPADPSVETPEVDIAADVAVPDTRLVPEVSAADDDEVIVVNDDSGDDDETEVAVDASPCSALGTAAEVRGVDAAEVSGDTTCRPVPAEVPAACVTAAASPDKPAGLVVAAGVVNAVNVDAAADAPA
jgi:hypothetical protein